MFQKIPILGVDDLQVGDKFRFNHWNESSSNDQCYYKVTSIDSVGQIARTTFYDRNHLEGMYYGTEIRNRSLQRYPAHKILDFVPYDPNQMISDEDDL